MGQIRHIGFALEPILKPLHEIHVGTGHRIILNVRMIEQETMEYITQYVDIVV
jgi:hypothetical protein